MIRRSIGRPGAWSKILSVPAVRPGGQIRAFSVDPQLIIGSMTESIQAIHVYTSLPWWALIPITTFGLRTIWTLPLAILQRKRIRKQNSLRPIVSAMNPVLKLNLAKKVQSAKRVAEKAQESVATQPRNGQNMSEHMTESYLNIQSPLASMKYEEILVLTTKETRKRQKKLFKQHDVQLWKNFILPAFQIPLWVSMSMTMRDLCGWSTWESLSNKPLDSALYNEGILWFSDLTLADPYIIFPIILGITSLCNVEWTFKTLELLKITQKRKLRPTLTDSIANLSRMTVVFMMAISLHAPTGLTLYWLSSQVYSLVQNVLMDLMIPISFSPNKRFNYRQNKNKAAVGVVTERK